jgi:hypothetical protein
MTVIEHLKQLRSHEDCVLAAKLTLAECRAGDYTNLRLLEILLLGDVKFDELPDLRPEELSLYGLVAILQADNINRSRALALER